MADKALHGTVLVIDDIYGAVSKETKNKPYDRTNFESDFGKLPFRFVFSTAWDEAAGGYTVEEAIRAVEKEKIDGVLLDITFGKNHEDRLGLAILRELTARFPALPVIMMTSVARDEVWAESARLGAVDYLPKPLDARRLWQTLDRYVGVEPKHWLVGQASSFLEAVMSAAKASEGGRTAVMMTGDTGTGKELLAGYIGRHGARGGEPFVPIHIAPMSPEQQQAELFGAKKGSYTGASQDRKGYFEAANKGVAFLDEVGNIDMRTQANLLRVAESGEIAPIGEISPRHVDVQIVSATNADLARKVKDGEFRQDLWERLRGTTVNLPQLAQRREDIPLLFRHLLRVEAVARGKAVPVVPESLEVRLSAMPWPGNVRQLAKYAGRVFDAAGEQRTPSEEHFLSEMPAVDAMSPHLSSPIRQAGEMGNIGAPAQPVGAASPADRLQHLRLEELALLYAALEKTRDPVSGATNRAKAAALIKGKEKCNTNEFDRWIRGLWDELTPENRELAAQRFPELLAALKDTAGS